MSRRDFCTLILFILSTLLRSLYIPTKNVEEWWVECVDTKCNRDITSCKLMLLILPMHIYLVELKKE